MAELVAAVAAVAAVVVAAVAAVAAVVVAAVAAEAQRPRNGIYIPPNPGPSSRRKADPTGLDSPLYIALVTPKPF